MSDDLYRGVIPYLNVIGAAEAADFYKKAFAAEEITRMPADDGKRLMHCHLKIHDGSLMLSDVFPEWGYDHQPSHSFTMMLVVEEADPWWERAVAAGCEVISELKVEFWGDRFGTLRDPYGVMWGVNEPAKAK
ncbi:MULTISPECIES: glyoxalase/bleomycin resistance/extradiol dioxygenase family protein [Asticcacaulis]|uniref:VOC family protein n=1 Tax=Asticcacaulis TaxID=76890 RepID=UPI001AE652D7|nr:MULTISPECIES: VOC family protein [Asticcacaulis]MBP2159958.1 putative glyoxalase superfamily protein PhnB [Asticcacaulis solisilvae]MDR6801003.1 putative glyoxalase superfamily protein PhnB [Asticcacaulis sp. BE141]